ncbi:BnaC09g41950D [Brassica napus]|uniref:BnaC09g41950D protein n=1 Tax=Brassica napus TaxID=3708 RepID=A0A078GP90_BRANA|nr:BnaC09g41950D [Brassica napus]
MRMRCQSYSLLTKLKELEDDDENLKPEQEASLSVHVLTRDTSV